VKSKHPEKYHYNVSCYVCSKKFKTKGKLNTHMAVHMYVKPHSCPYCKKHFSDSSNLKMHLLIHTGIKDTNLLPFIDIYSAFYQRYYGKDLLVIFRPKK